MKSFSFFVAATIAVFFLIVATTTSDLAADRSALIALRSAVGGRSLLWNVSQTSPCGWVGVKCLSNRVSELRLPGMGLTGSIPVGTIGNLTQLHTLSLRFNSLSGPLPPDLSSLTNLRNLYLQNNFFSGPIPDSIFSLSSLVRLNLADNNFSGSISPSFNNLTRLSTLYLQNNRLNGSIPDLNLSLVQFNVSNNQLIGEVPQKFSGMPASVFMGNSLCGGPLLACNGTSSHTVRKKLSGGAIAGIVIGSVVVVLLIAFILIFCCRKNGGDKELKSGDERVVKQVETDIPREKSIESEDKGSFRVGYGEAAGRGGKEKENVGGGGGKNLVFFGKMNKAFDLEDLLRASAEVLGKGAFGTTYKAVMEMGATVAVKRLKDVNVPDKEFKERMEEVGKMNQENLVPLRAYYYGRDEKLLVYDYIPMGSLSALLHGDNCFLFFLKSFGRCCPPSFVLSFLCGLFL